VDDELDPIPGIPGIVDPGVVLDPAVVVEAPQAPRVRTPVRARAGRRKVRVVRFMAVDLSE